MPTRPLTQKDKPKDNKQILLDLINKQYGPSNAIVMEKALKTQDKQIEEAMLQGGATANDIGKSVGIDLSSLGNLSNAPLQQLNIQKPQSLMQNILGQSGITTNQQGQPTGVKQGGFFDFNVGPTNTLIQQLLGLSQTQGQKIQTRLGEQELRGEKPLQRGEREKLGIQGSIDLQKEIIKQAQEGLLKPNEIFTKFETASQPFIIVRDSHSRVEASAKDPSAAGDLALIFNYMKVLDPGSTVREGEFATAQEAASFLQRRYGQWARFTTGGRLSPKTRTDFLDRSRRLFNSVETQQKKTTEEFSKLAIRSNLDPKVIIRDVGLQSYIPKDISNKQNINSGTTKSGNTYRRLP